MIKRCGNCKHWLADSADPKVGACGAPLPYSVETIVPSMGAQCGNGCLVFQPNLPRLPQRFTYKSGNVWLFGTCVPSKLDDSWVLLVGSRVEFFRNEPDKEIAAMLGEDVEYLWLDRDQRWKDKCNEVQSRTGGVVGQGER